MITEGNRLDMPGVVERRIDADIDAVFQDDGAAESRAGFDDHVIPN